MYKPGITVHVMCRNEKWTIWEAIMSTAPFVEGVVVCDTGSTDNTKELIEDAFKLLPETVHKVFLKRQLPDLQPWSAVHGQRNPHPSRDLGDVRNLMRDHTDTEWIWTVDADEVYYNGSADKIKRAASTLPAKMDCVYLPIIWTGHDPNFETGGGGTYGITGRLFRNRPGYCHRTGPECGPNPAVKLFTQQEGANFPGEAARYLLPDESAYVPVPGRRGNCMKWSIRETGRPIVHYEMATKPWRRRAGRKSRHIPPPEIFERSLKRFGTNLYNKTKRR